MFEEGSNGSQLRRLMRAVLPVSPPLTGVNDGLEMSHL